VRFLEQNTSIIWILLATLLSVLLSPSPLLLDEETHLWIAQQAAWFAPYDWAMPFPPFHETGFVFAHPPLFLWWLKLTGDSVFTAVPWLLLWWWSAWKLAEQHQVSPKLVLGMMLASAGVLMPLSRSMMPDLMVSALGAAALVLYGKAESRSSNVVAGCILGLAMWTKYPAVMLIVIPILWEKKFGKLLPFVCGALGVFFCGEFWIFMEYGEWHLWTVLQEAQVVGRGELSSRVVGLPLRLGLALLPMALIGLSVRPMFPLVIGLIGLFVWGDSTAIYLTLGTGVMALLWKGNRWLVSWVLLVWLGVVVGHNYASPRYWLVTCIPLSVLAVQHCVDWKQWKQWTVIGVATLWMGTLMYTERIHANEIVRLTTQIETDLHNEYPNSIEEIAFSGEWTFRQQMLERGYLPFDHEGSHTQNMAQKMVLTAVNSAGWTPHTDDGWTKVQMWEAQSVHVRLSVPEDSVGWYADTLGFYPVQLLRLAKPIDRVELWKKQ